MKPPAKGKPPPDNPRISSIGANRGWPDTPTVQNGSLSPVFAGVQLLAGLEGISGFLLIGWSTAYLVAASTRSGPFQAGKHF